MAAPFGSNEPNAGGTPSNSGLSTGAGILNPSSGIKETRTQMEAVAKATDQITTAVVKLGSQGQQSIQKLDTALSNLLTKAKQVSQAIPMGQRAGGQLSLPAAGQTGAGVLGTSGAASGYPPPSNVPNGGPQGGGPTGWGPGNPSQSRSGAGNGGTPPPGGPPTPPGGGPPGGPPAPNGGFQTRGGKGAIAGDVAAAGIGSLAWRGMQQMPSMYQATQAGYALSLTNQMSPNANTLQMYKGTQGYTSTQDLSQSMMALNQMGQPAFSPAFNRSAQGSSALATLFPGSGMNQWASGLMGTGPGGLYSAPVFNRMRLAGVGALPIQPGGKLTPPQQVIDALNQRVFRGETTPTTQQATASTAPYSPQSMFLRQMGMTPDDITAIQTINQQRAQYAQKNPGKPIPNAFTVSGQKALGGGTTAAAKQLQAQAAKETQQAQQYPSMADASKTMNDAATKFYQGVQDFLKATGLQGPLGAGKAAAGMFPGASFLGAGASTIFGGGGGKGSGGVSGDITGLAGSAMHDYEMYKIFQMISGKGGGIGGAAGGLIQKLAQLLRRIPGGGGGIVAPKGGGAGKGILSTIAGGIGAAGKWIWGGAKKAGSWIGGAASGLWNWLKRGPGKGGSWTRPSGGGGPADPEGPIKPDEIFGPGEAPIPVGDSRMAPRRSMTGDNTTTSQQGKQQTGQTNWRPGGKSTVNALEAMLNQLGTPHKVTATTKGQDDDSYHTSSQAIDVGSHAGPKDQATLLRLNQQIARQYGPGLAELIYSAPGARLIREGKPVGPGVFGKKVMDQHKDHIHVAATETSLKAAGINLQGKKSTTAPGNRTQQHPGSKKEEGASITEASILGAGFPNIIKGRATSKVATPAPAPGAAPSGGDDKTAVGVNVGQWIKQALTILNQDTPGNEEDVKIIISHEDASGDPHSQNNSDSNARAGNPSFGLMQTTGTTFRENALPGHTNKWDPVDQIIAGVRYAEGRYKSLDNVPGVKSIKAGGGYLPYDTGSWEIAKDQLALLHKGEMVVPQGAAQMVRDKTPQVQAGSTTKKVELHIDPGAIVMQVMSTSEAEAERFANLVMQKIEDKVKQAELVTN